MATRFSSTPNRPPRRRSGGWRAGAILGALVVVAAVVAVVLVTTTSNSKPTETNRSMESLFQDDGLLVYAPTPTVVRTLDILRALGVDRLRIQVLWLAIAPFPHSAAEPTIVHSGARSVVFNPTDPASYPASSWAPYDRIDRLATARGIKLDFNVTAPGPLWAMRSTSNSRYAPQYRPSASAFGQFVAAVGKRYSGTWPVSPGSHRRLPRVSYWTIWNEPNQPGWLAPQRQTVRGTTQLESAVLYRGYADAGVRALVRTGHPPSKDTLLIGELAPEGSETHKAEAPVPPMPFLRALYCVDSSYHPLRGQAARALSCPASGSTSGFVSSNPGLFEPTGFAHHPYSFFLSPNASLPDPNYAPLSDLSRLENGLDRIFSAYGVGRQLPIWITEYGYETNPPNPFRGVSPATQARYLDQAQYMAWEDPRVRSMAQFLLVDSAPNKAFPRGSVGYWSTFQTGLEYLSGERKPSFYSYPLPVWVPKPTFSSGSSVLVWGMLRAAPNGTAQHAKIQWRGTSGSFRNVAQVSTSDPSGFFTTDVHLPGSGAVRIEWTSTHGATLHSRLVVVRQTGS